VSCGLLVEESSFQSHRVYQALLLPLGSSGATGEVTIFTSTSGLTGTGSGTGLEPSLTAASKGGLNCTATNGCGVHVHSGTACTNASTQGGHYFSSARDPWIPVGYTSTSSKGDASFKFDISDGATDIAGKPFIVHSNGGGRVACGLLSEVTSGVRVASLAQLSTSGVTGSVTIYAASDKVIGAGSAMGLEASLADPSVGGSDCTAMNGCGVHVHSGTACTDATTQGGHYYTGRSDPWEQIRYSSTDASGSASFIFSVNGPSDVTGKPFIIHNNAGGRVSCGLLHAARGLVNASGTTSNLHALSPASRFGEFLSKHDHA